jgi:hypothetical protein
MKGEIMKSKRLKITKCFIVLSFFTLSFLLAVSQPVSYAAADNVTVTAVAAGNVTVTASAPPVIVETDPAIYPPHEEVPISQIIRIVFNQDVDQEATKSAFAVYQLSETGAIRHVEGNCSVEGKVLTFTPSSFLAVGSIYQVTEGSNSWYFVTVADDTPPEITDCSPASEDTGIFWPTDITFHIRDNNAGVDPSSLILKVNDKPVIPSLTSVSKTDLSVTYPPSVFLPFSGGGDGEKITVSIHAEDFVHNAVDYSYSFTTLRQLDRPWFREGEGMENIAAMAIDGQDHVWVALRQSPDDGSGGVKMFDGSQWHQYTSANGLGSDSATAIAVDSHNQVWVGLLSDSDPADDSADVPKLAKLDPNAWTTYSAKDLGVPADEEINEIAVDSHDHIWIATDQSGVIELSAGSIQHWGPEDGSLVRAIAIDKNGDIWAGTVPYGVMRLHDSVWEQYVYSVHAKDLYPVDFTVNDLAVDDNGKVWAATNCGLLQLVPGADSSQDQWMHFIPGEFVNAVTIDRSSGSIWVGTKDNLLKFDGQSAWVNYSTGEPNYPLSTESITDIAINPNTKHSEIWVAGNSSLVRRDKNYPRIASTSPLAGATDVPKNAPVKITFTEAMNQSSIPYFSLYDSRGVRVQGTAIIEGDVLTFTPASPLTENGIYTIKATGDMHDLAGNCLDGNGNGLGGEEADTFSASFTVEHEKIPPQVVSVSPVNGAKNVPQNTKVNVTFSEAMDHNSAGYFGLYDSQQASVPGLATIAGNTLTFTPASVLKQGETYTLKAGREMKDLAGNMLDGDKDGLGGEEADTFSAGFTVVKQAVVTPPNTGLWPLSYSGLPFNGLSSGLNTGGLYTGFAGGMTSPFTQVSFVPQWSSPFGQPAAFNLTSQINNFNNLLGQALWNPMPTPFGLPLF